MLKILCCVKQVPDVDQMRMDPETGNLIRAGVPAILNPQDANALSAAMKVKETCGGEVTLITMGPPNAEAALRECLAVGADKAVLVTDRAFGNADTLATSYSILSAADTQDKFDMIFCGKESLDGATGQMGAQLAQRFGTAQVTGALLIKEVNEEVKTVSRFSRLSFRAFLPWKRQITPPAYPISRVSLRQRRLLSRPLRQTISPSLTAAASATRAHRRRCPACSRP